MATNPVQKNEIAAKGVADNLTKGLKESREEVVKLNKSLIELGKTQKKNIELQKKRPDTIKKAKELNKVTKKAGETVKAINKTREVSVKLDKQIIAAESKLIASKTKRAKQVQILNLETKKNNELNKEAALIGQKNLGTLERISVRNKQLIRERRTLNLETKKGRDRLKLINKELDKNNLKIKANVSNLEKQKIGIGDYAGGLKEAAGASGLFGGILGKLGAVQATLNALMKVGVKTGQADVATRKAQAAAIAQMTVAQRAGNLATRAGIKSLKAIKIALASTGIGILLVALGSLWAMFTRSQGAVDALDDQMARLGATFDVIIDRFAEAGEGFVDIWNGVISGVVKTIKSFEIMGKRIEGLAFVWKPFSDEAIKNREEVEALTEEFRAISSGDILGGLAKVREAFRNIAGEIVEDSEAAKLLNALTREATREAKLFEAQQSATLTTVKKLNLISRDKLNTDEERIEAIKKANALEIVLSEKQIEIQDKLLASALDALTADGKGLKLAGERLDFVNRIKEGNVGSAEAIKLAAKFTLSSAAGEQALFDIIEKIKEQEAAKASLLDKQATTVKKLSALYVIQATKEGMALMRIATAKRELAKNDELTIVERTELLKQAAIAEVNAFRVQTNVHVKNEEELAAARIQIKAKFISDVKKLEEDEEKRRIAEENRLLAIESKRLSGIEAIRQEAIEREIEDQERLLDNLELSASEQIVIIQKIFDLRIKAIEEAATFQIEQLSRTEKEAKENAAQITLIAAKLTNDVVDLEHEKFLAVRDANDLIVENDEDAAKKRLESAKKLGQAISREFTSIIQERNKESLKLADADIKRAEDAVTRQTEIAEKGQENILGEAQANLEKANLARKREAERAAKQEQNIALALGFLNNLAARQKSAKNKEESNAAFALALRDTLGAKLIAEGLASFYDGTEDTGTTANPLDSKGGRKVIVHDNERIMTAKQNDRMGGISNDAAADIIHNYQHGNLDLSPSHFKQLEVHSFMRPQSNNMQPIIAQMQKDTDRIEGALKKYQSTTTYALDSIGNLIKKEVRSGMKKTTNHTRSRLG